MSDTLQEFLVSIKYAVDRPGQEHFFDTLKKISTSVGGIAAELSALSLSVVGLTDILAKSGEKLYWMSERVGDSVSNIQQLSFAMSNLGMSSDEALNSIEKFSGWTRSMGPAATNYLRQLGVTATDTVGRMRQLGEYFRSHGGTYAQQGTMEYAVALRQWQMMGGSEQSMLDLSSGRLEKQEQLGGMIQRLVWGKDWQRGPQQFAEQSNLVMNEFRQMGFFFTNLAEKFGLGLFHAVLPELRHINELLIQMLPTWERFLQHIIDYAPMAMHFVEGLVKGFGFLIDTLNIALKTFQQLPDDIKTMIEAIAGLEIGLKLARSPLMLLMAGFAAFLLLLEDYQVWKERGQGPHGSYFDWGSADKIIDPLEKTHKKINDFIQDLTGLHHGLEIIGGTAFALGRVASALRLIAINAGAANAAAGGAAGGSLASRLFGMAGTLLRRIGMVAVPLVLGHEDLEMHSDDNRKLAQKYFGNTDTASLVKAQMARELARVTGRTPEEQLRMMFPQHPDVKEAAKPPDERGGARPPPAPKREGPVINLGIGDWIHKYFGSENLRDWGGIFHSIFGKTPDRPPHRPNLGISDWFHRYFGAENLKPWLRNYAQPTEGDDGYRKWFKDKFGIEPGSDKEALPAPYNTSQLRLPGSYQLASASTSFPVPASASAYATPGTEQFDRMYDLLRRSFGDTIDVLNDIGDTLTDIAEGIGAPTSARQMRHGFSAGGEQGEELGPGEQIKAGDLRDMVQEMWHLNPHDAAVVTSNIMAESSGNAGAIEGGGPWVMGQRQGAGLFQFTGDVRRDYEEWAKRKGIDPRNPRAQMQFLLEIMNTRPEYRGWREALSSGDPLAWTRLVERPAAQNVPGHARFIPQIEAIPPHVPLGTDAGVSRGGTDGRGSDRNINVTNQTSIAVSAPSPQSAAVMVAEAQTRVNENHIRVAAGRLV